MSASIACRLYTVSSSVSPFEVEEAPTFRLITSADRRLAAISKVVRVRVEFSKKTLKIDLPRSSGTFFTSRSLTEHELVGGVEDVADDLRRQPLGGEQVAQACRRRRPAGLARSFGPPHGGEAQPAVLVGEHQLLAGADLDRRAEEIGARPAARARRGRRAPRGARRAGGRSRTARSAPRGWCARCAARRRPARSRARRPANGIWLRRDSRCRPMRPKSSRCSVTASMPSGAVEPERAMQPLGDPGAARVDADQRRRRGASLPRICAGERLDERLGIRQRGAHGPPASVQVALQDQAAASASTSPLRFARVRAARAAATRPRPR